MDFEPHNFPALVASVIRSDPALAEPLKEIFAAYARNEDLDERWAQIDVKFHQSLRLILEDLNEIDDPVSLDQEIQVLLQAIDQAHLQVEEDTVAPLEKKTSGKKKVSKPAKKKAGGVKKKAGGAKKKASGVKKKAGGAKKKASGAKKKAAKPARKKTAGAKKKTAKPATKKAKGVKKKASKPAKKKAAVKKKAAGAKKKAATKPIKKKKKK